MKVLLLGATGLIGSSLLNLLLSDSGISQIIVLSRRDLPIQDSRLSVHNLEISEATKEHFDSVDSVFSCLGTTIKKAGSREKFREVDFDLVYSTAKYAEEKSVKQFHMVSSLGADPNSPIFYSRVKGEIEEELKKMKIPSVSIFQPSLLIGERQEVRMGEKFGEYLGYILSPIFWGPIRKYKPISADRVAQAMYWTSKQPQNGVAIYESDRIYDISIRFAKGR